MNKLPILFISLMVFVASTFAQTSTNTTISPMFTPPQISTGTNWLNNVASKVEVSGVLSISLNNHTPQTGGIATMWTFIDENWSDKLHFKAGPSIMVEARNSELFGGLGTTVNVIQDGSLEKTLNTTPILDLVPRLVKWSDLYLFITVGSQLNSQNPFIGIGGGIRCW